MRHVREKVKITSLEQLHNKTVFASLSEDGKKYIKRRHAAMVR